jgi:hypothetical protein
MPNVASLSIDAKSADGATFNVGLEIGAPYQIEEGEWACPVTLRGLHEGLPDIRGVDSFQALCLAIGLALTLLQNFVDKGGTLSAHGDRLALEAYALGAARSQG